LDYSQAVNLSLRFALKARYTIVATKLGWVVIGGSEIGLSFLTLPQPFLEAVLAGIEDFVKGAVEEDSAFGDLPLRLQCYFDGEMLTFPDKLDLEEATDFQQVVWNATRSIPYGEVRSYAWVAKRIGRPGACRAVGGALARNRFPIIVPCHRVVASDGTLGGFGGGLGLKKHLLSIEAGRVRKSSSESVLQSSPAR
jgi:methylated-DNA-[protein]-cysteine S-methyltransferase